MSNYSGGVSVCPFYVKESGLSMQCAENPEKCEETEVDALNQCSISLKFPSSKAKLKHQREYCLRFNYPYCPLAAFYLTRVHKTLS